MRLRRVAIDVKKQVRGRTVRTAGISLRGHRDSDDSTRLNCPDRALIRAQSWPPMSTEYPS